RDGVPVLSPAEPFVPDVGAFGLQEQAEGIHVLADAAAFTEVSARCLRSTSEQGTFGAERLLSLADDEVTGATEDGGQVEGGVDRFTGKAGVQATNVTCAGFPLHNDGV